MAKAWIGIDFDHTLCKSDGSPIDKMVYHAKQWLARDFSLRIVTARVNPLDWDDDEIARERQRITRWCKEHLGIILPIQWGKSSGMIALFDDKAIHVRPDTGEIQYPSADDCGDSLMVSLGEDPP